ncbi:MAG TPA: SH3 domain-containing protein [Gemmataceae bacterium]|jgi:hypothetical protein|nr:SH3 domain-containing protein [Gemmataceae bacterium]
MMLLFFVLGLPPGINQANEPIHLLERARALHEEIGQKTLEGRDPRALYRTLSDICAQLRRARPKSLPLCMNEGNAASMAGDWPHALLAYRLAQRLAPADPAVASRLTAARALLMQSDGPASAWNQAAAVLATNVRLRASFWLMALLLYAAAWMRIAAFVSRPMESGILLALVGMAAAGAIVASLFWADAYRQRALSQTLAVIRRGEPPLLREGNGLSYPAASETRLRPGAELSVLTQRGSWLQVRTANGQIGWIPSGAADVE